jgi:hypothetical protein
MRRPAETVDAGYSAGTGKGTQRVDDLDFAWPLFSQGASGLAG